MPKREPSDLRGGQAVTTASILERLKRSFAASAGTIVFGMMDGTISIFGLIFGVAATTSSSATVLIAGASGAAAAAVSMTAGAYLDAETSRDEVKLNQAQIQADLAVKPDSIGTVLSERLTSAGIPQGPAAALSSAVHSDPEAVKGLLLAVQAAQVVQLNPVEQALWMLLADFVAATVPLLPFVVLPISQARPVCAVATIAFLVALGIGRARLAGSSVVRMVLETVLIGIAAAVAGVGIGVLIERVF